MITDKAIKPFLCHEEKIVREHAAKYFEESFSKDPELMPLVLKSCDLYGEKENSSVLALSGNYVQSEETIRMVLQRLQKIKDVNVLVHYNRIIAKADLQLLVSMEKEISNSQNIMGEYLEKIHRRIKLSKTGTEELWDMLLNFADQYKNDYVNKFDFNYGMVLVEALARKEDLKESEVINLLEDQDAYCGYDEIYMAVLAGYLQSKKAIPVLIDKLRIDTDLLCEKALSALSMIGTDEVIRSVADVFLEEDWSFKIYASGIFGSIKSPASEKTLIKLLPQEEDITIKTILADGLCKLLSTEGFPYVQDLIKAGYDTICLSLEESLYAACRITDTTLPELVEWKKMIDEEDVRRESIHNGQIGYGQVSKEEKKVGRNQPCPCGSGKKYKKCCGNK